MIGTPQQMGTAIQGYNSPLQGVGGMADTLTGMMMRNQMAQDQGKNIPFPALSGLFGIGGQNGAVAQNPATASAVPTV
jgi:hypothetical protein